MSKLLDGLWYSLGYYVASILWMLGLLAVVVLLAIILSFVPAWRDGLEKRKNK